MAAHRPASLDLSLLRMSAATRLAGAGILSLVLWALVLAVIA